MVRLSNHNKILILLAAHFIARMYGENLDYPFLQPGNCTIRYLFRETIKNTISCKKVIETNSLCGRDFVVAYSELLPYIFTINGTHYGSLIGLLEEALISTCCLGCNKLKILPKLGFLEKFEYLKNESFEADIIMPMEGTTDVFQFFGFPYQPLILQKDIAFIGKTPNQENINLLNILYTGVVQSWPLFTLALSMTIAAGSIIWFLDTWYNKSHFPTTFPRGVIEGFWWAYVSMTTVGYGDRTPSSILARIFAVIWILIGILFFNMYTATFTSLLSNAMSNVREFELVGKKVGVLNSTSSSHIAIALEMGVAVVFGDEYEMRRALEDDEVLAVAMETRTAFYYLPFLAQKQPSIQIQKRTSIAHAKSAIGLTITDGDIAATLKSFFESNKENIDLILSNVVQKQGIDIGENYQKLHRHTTKPPRSLEIGSEFLLYGATIFVAISIVVCLLGILMNRCVERNKLKPENQSALPELKETESKRVRNGKLNQCEHTKEQRI